MDYFTRSKLFVEQLKVCSTKEKSLKERSFSGNPFLASGRSVVHFIKNIVFTVFYIVAHGRHINHEELQHSFLFASQQ